MHQIQQIYFLSLSKQEGEESKREIRENLTDVGDSEQRLETFFSFDTVRLCVYTF